MAECHSRQNDMDYYSKQISKLIAELSTLPGIGAKSAQRLAFHILDMPTEEVEDLANAMVSARKGVHYCKQCYTLTDDEICPICSNPQRNQKRDYGCGRYQRFGSI